MRPLHTLLPHLLRKQPQKHLPVEEIVRSELADTAAPPEPEPRLTAADVEVAIRAAMAEMPQP